MGSMNKVMKEAVRKQLLDEESALRALKRSFTKARKDILEKIAGLNARDDLQNIQSIIYQRKYQEELLKQIEGALDELNKGQHKTLDEFLTVSYENGYLGGMYDIHKQGVPIVAPIDLKKVERARQAEAKLSKAYYQNRTLPENLSKMSKSIRLEISRGIATGASWLEVAYQIAEGMNSPITRAMNDAMRIVRTEGHRVNQMGFLDAGDEAIKAGADILKQWDATLDGNTRPAHKEADGQIRKWGENFLVGGEFLKAPSVGGSAGNVINCRCQILQRARWALDDDELEKLKDRADYFGLDKAKGFEEFKEKYMETFNEKNDISDLLNAHSLREQGKEYASMLKEQYYLGKIPNIRELKEITWKDVHITKRDLIRILDKHGKEFSGFEMGLLYDVIRNPDLICDNSWAHRDSLLLYKRIPQKDKVIMECAIIPKDSDGYVIHFHKIKIKKVNKLRDSQLIIYKW